MPSSKLGHQYEPLNIKLTKTKTLTRETTINIKTKYRMRINNMQMRQYNRKPQGPQTRMEYRVELRNKDETKDTRKKPQTYQNSYEMGIYSM